MLNSKRYLNILNYICDYYGISNAELAEIMRSKDNKYMILLLLKNNNCLDIESLKDMLKIKNKSSINNSVKLAEKKFLINSYFRNAYFSLEENLEKIK